MNIKHIKDQLNQPVLNMVRQLAQDKTTSTAWLSHWDADNRIRVTMHEEVYNKIKADATFDRLALKKELVQPKDATKAPYTRYVVITPTHLEAAF